MGCDGGSIAKRKEVVKTKKQEEQPGRSCELSSKWQFCHLSGMRLKQPIVSCQLGRLYNKEAILEFLLNSKAKKIRNSEETKAISKLPLPHVKSMKDVKDLNLKTNSNNSNQVSTNSNSTYFVCPITNLEMNGRYKFCYLLKCGCVLSDRALKQIPDDGKCLVCSTNYNANIDVITINASAKDLEELKANLKRRRMDRLKNSKP